VVVVVVVIVVTMRKLIRCRYCISLTLPLVNRTVSFPIAALVMSQILAHVV
jgi:hypothetical protein